IEIGNWNLGHVDIVGFSGKVGLVGPGDDVDGILIGDGDVLGSLGQGWVGYSPNQDRHNGNYDFSFHNTTPVFKEVKCSTD
ncbi:hypothetical protein DRQ12_03940, partial [candidate division KSB1 bacterium]